MLFFLQMQFFPQTDVWCLLYMAYICNDFKALWFSLDTTTITSFLYTFSFTVLPCSDQYRIVSRCAYLGISLYLLWSLHIYKNMIRSSSTSLACLIDLEPIPTLQTIFSPASMVKQPKTHFGALKTLDAILKSLLNCSGFFQATQGLSFRLFIKGIQALQLSLIQGLGT